VVRTGARTRFPMAASNPNDTPSIVTAEGGEVLVCGPDGRAYSRTFTAAVETSARLLLAAAEAGEQLKEQQRRAGT